MPILALIAAGVVENVIIGSPADYPSAVDVTAANPRPAPGWTFSGGAFHPPAAAPAQPVARRVTRLAFRNRFTTAELVALEIASLDNPAAAMAARQGAASIRVLMASLDAATFIDLERADTRAGVNQLEAVGLLAAGRAAAILDAPVEPAEEPLNL